jgi:hypothetical protein
VELSCRSGPSRGFPLNPQPLTERTAARELADRYLKAAELTRRNTRVHFIQPLKERIVREVGHGLSLEDTSAADLVKSMRAKTEPEAATAEVA